MDFNFDDLTNNNELTNDNLSIDGMGDWTTDLDLGSVHCLDDSDSGDGGGGGTDVAYGSPTFGVFDGDL